jgi:hypothetical protein
MVKVICKKQKLNALREIPGKPSVFGGVRVAHLFCFLCCVYSFILSVFVLCRSWFAPSVLSVFVLCRSWLPLLFCLSSSCVVIDWIKEYTQHRKQKRWATRTPPKTEGLPGISRRAFSFCFLQITFTIFKDSSDCYVYGGTNTNVTLIR